MTTASEHPQTGRRSGRHRLLKDNVTVIADAVLPVYLNPAGKPDESDAVVRADQFMPDANQQLARAEYRLAVELSRSGEKDFAEKYFARAGELSRRLTTSRSAADRCRYAGRVRSANRSVERYKEWEAVGRPYYTEPVDGAQGR